MKKELNTLQKVKLCGLIPNVCAGWSYPQSMITKSRPIRQSSEHHWAVREAGKPFNRTCSLNPSRMVQFGILKFAGILPESGASQEAGAVSRVHHRP